MIEPNQCLSLAPYGYLHNERRRPFSGGVWSARKLLYLDLKAIDSTALGPARTDGVSVHPRLPGHGQGTVRSEGIRLGPFRRPARYMFTARLRRDLKHEVQDRPGRNNRGHVILVGSSERKPPQLNAHAAAPMEKFCNGYVSTATA